MLSTRLIQMVESHAEELTGGLIQQLRTNPRTPAFRRFSDMELHNRTFNTYRNLGAWMVGKPEEEIREHYEGLGQRRRQEGIPLQEVVYALILVKRHLLNYARNHGLGGTAVEIYGEQELSNQVNQFFDNAIYYTAVGYERSFLMAKAISA